MLTDLQRKKLPNLFHLHDVDSDGLIQPADYDQVARDLAQSRGLAPDSSEAEELRSRFATAWDNMSHLAGDGGLSLDGWFAHWDEVLSTDGMYDEVISPIGEFIFEMLDRDGDGRVESAEYVRFYQVMGLDEASATEVFSQLDRNGDGSLSRGEISDMLEQYFCSDSRICILRPAWPQQFG